MLLLFGGGLTLSAVLGDSGASKVLGDLVAHTFGGAPTYIVLLVTAVFIICLTEFTSNTASAALLVPVFAGVAAQMGATERNPYYSNRCGRKLCVYNAGSDAAKCFSFRNGTHSPGGNGTKWWNSSDILRVFSFGIRVYFLLVKFRQNSIVRVSARTKYIYKIYF